MILPHRPRAAWRRWPRRTNASLWRSERWPRFIVMPPKANSRFWCTGPGGRQARRGRCSRWGLTNERGLRPFQRLRVILEKWIPKTIFAAPRSSWPKGGASYNNREAA